MFSKKMVVLLACAIVAVGVFTLTEYSSNSGNAQTQYADNEELKKNTAGLAQTSDVPFSTLKDMLQRTASTPSASSTLNRPFTKEQVFMALQAVKVDANGDVVLDHATLIALDEALERIHAKLSPSDLQALKHLIMDALPGKVGEQVALLVENYTEFLGAKEIFSSTQEALVEPSLETQENIDDNEQLYNELKTLRELHLGENTANSLFSVTDASAAYMFDAMKLSLDTTLSEQEIAAAQQELQDKQIRDALSIDDWDARYDRFLDEWSTVKRSSLSEAAQQQEFKALLAAHFTALEREKMAYFGLTTAS
ncbi:hypothetical protein [Alteromonas sp. S167]|uniref:hypothetical protein n=1 Tax=Alteromonas sp. S167 TaxID=3117402 RepID=UPI002FE26930